MARKNFHDKVFDKGTKDKLDIFREYFRESIPVFVYSPMFDEIFIYDFFAGQGKDIKGQYGTAINILKEITNHCDEIRKRNKQVFLVYNDNEVIAELEMNVRDFLKDCKETCKGQCIFNENKNLIFRSREFEEFFNEIYPKLKKWKKAAKLIFLDPYNFILDKSLFGKLMDLSSGDFVCFLPSSILKRFPDEPAFKRFIDKQEMNFKDSKPEHCHRVIADYFTSLISEGKEYYIGCFSIKKGANYYGLLFGSSHTLGAEKFQEVCWGKDEITGEANYNIDRELKYNNQTVLFKENEIPLKIRNFNAKLKEAILKRRVTTDKDAYKFALTNRCKVEHAAGVLKVLMHEKRIKNFRTRKSDIHKIKIPQGIKLL